MNLVVIIGWDWRTVSAELGKCYFWGDGVPKDKDMAYQYFRKVSDQGKDFADDYLSPDKLSLRSEAEVEALINYR